MTKNMACCVMFLCCSVLSAYGAEDIVTRVLGCPNDPCIVRVNDGGDVDLFEQAAAVIARGARSRIVIDGPCASACTILVDKVVDKVCLTERAQLYFHKGTEYSITITSYILPTFGFGINAKEVRHESFYVPTLFEPDYSPTVTRWIRAIGGLPKNGEFVIMPDQLARKIWRSCT